MANGSNQIRYAISGLRQRVTSRARLAEVAKTLTVVVPLTLLIWIYAERAQPAVGTARVPIDVSVADSSLTAAIVDQSNPTIEIKMTGPRVLFDALQNQLRQLSMEQGLRLALDPSQSQVGSKTIDLQQKLNETPIIRDSGVTIDSVTPTTVRVSVEHVASRAIGLELPPNTQVSLQHVTFDPPTVTVRGPQSEVESLLNSDHPRLMIDGGNLVETINQAGGRPVEVTVVPPREFPRLTVSPMKVRMSYEVGSREIDGQIPSVAVVIERPIAQEGRFRVKPKLPVVRNVTIHGPVDQVSKLTGDEPSQRLTAVLRVSADDIGKSDVTRAVDFQGLPPGVTVTGGPYTVEFDVIDNGISPLDR